MKKDWQEGWAICPQCGRAISFEAMGGVDVNGNRVLAWHLNSDGTDRCDGSYRAATEPKETK